MHMQLCNFVCEGPKREAQTFNKVEAHKIARAHNYKHKKIDWFLFLCIYLWTNQFLYAYGHAPMQFYVLTP